MNTELQGKAMPKMGFKTYVVKMDKTALPVITIQITTGRDNFFKGFDQQVSDF